MHSIGRNKRLPKRFALASRSCMRLSVFAFTPVKLNPAMITASIISAPIILWAKDAPNADTKKSPKTKLNPNKNQNKALVRYLGLLRSRKLKKAVSIKMQPLINKINLMFMMEVIAIPPLFLERAIAQCLWRFVRREMTSGLSARVKRPVPLEYPINQYQSVLRS